jgi:hypothetical protein
MLYIKMTDSDYVKCQSIGNLKVIATSDFDKQVKGQTAYTPNLLSPLNKTFIGKCCVYDMTRLLDTICITVRRSLDTPEDCAALVRDLDSIYDYSLIHLSEIASDHPSFIKRTRVKYYIYSPIAVDGYTFGKIPVFTTILGDKFSDVMYESTFSVVFNDLEQFVRFQDSNHDRNIHVYNQPHNVFNDFTREKDTPVYTHFDKQAWGQPAQPSVFNQQPAQPSVFNQQPAQPSVFNQQPAQPSVFNQPPAQPSVFNQPPVQPSVFNQQPAQPSMFNQPPAQPSMFNQQPAQPSMFNQQPAQPSVFNQPPAQPSMFNQQPAQPSMFNQQPAQPYMFNQQPAQPSMFNQQPAQPSMFNQQPAQPSVFNQQPAQPSMFNQQPAQPSMFNQQPAQPSMFNQQPAQPSMFNQQPAQPAQPSVFNQQKSSLFNQQPAQPSMFNQQPAQPSIFQSFGQQQKPSNNTGFVFQDPFAKK